MSIQKGLIETGEKLLISLIFFELVKFWNESVIPEKFKFKYLKIFLKQGILILSSSPIIKIYFELNLFIKFTPPPKIILNPYIYLYFIYCLLCC